MSVSPRIGNPKSLTVRNTPKSIMILKGESFVYVHLVCPGHSLFFSDDHLWTS